MIGRGLMRAIASTTFWVNAFPLVLTPMRAVGFWDSMTATKSFEGSCGCAYGFWKSYRSVRLGSSSPWTSNSEMRARASSSDRPSSVMAEAIRSAIPTPAEPAPRNSTRWSRSLPPVTRRR